VNRLGIKLFSSFDSMMEWIHANPTLRIIHGVIMRTNALLTIFLVWETLE